MPYRLTEWDELKPPIYTRVVFERCSAFADGKCTNGFPVTRGCIGGYRHAPICMDEALCEELYPETGKPKDTVNDQS